MCGIAGYYNSKNASQMNQRLYQACSLISHRGPDDEGYAFFNLGDKSKRDFCGPDSPESLQKQLPLITEAGPFAHHLAFGFRRFSIVDLSERGHQPFWSQDGTNCLIFNGEIYNYVEIRQELEKLGCIFQTVSDTEVLMIGYQVWGIEVLNKCNGPLALALLDWKKNRLILARDRLGKSPLYYTVQNETLYWASEIKSILHMAGHSSFQINKQAVYDYLNFGWRDIDNQTFRKDIYTLPAACWTDIHLGEIPSQEKINANLHRYWTFPENRRSPQEIPFHKAKIQFRKLFIDAVRIRIRADAKIALSLSGGLDSSSIVAAAAGALNQKFRAYSLEFPGEKENEEPYARAVFNLYPKNIDYHTYIPENQDFWEVANDFIWLQEEPFHWPSAELFQAYFRHARREGYKVMLIGAGGDELLAGYRDYFFPMLEFLRDAGRFMPLVGNLFGNQNLWPKYCIRKRFKILRDLLSHRRDNFGKYIPVSFFNSSGEASANKYFKDPQIIQRLKHRKLDVLADFHSKTIGYMSNWLMNYWLRNSNHAHFGVPMEPRCPLLDYRLIDFVFSLPPEYLIRRGWTKYILRKSMHQLLPGEVTWRRRKQGMPFNTQAWFTHAKPIVQQHLTSVADNPYLDTMAFLNDYDTLLAKNPQLLWRGINFCLWWKRVIMQQLL